MASRMESHGTPDEIQITRSTWQLLRDDFVTEPIGLVEVKGKGEVETWRLVGARTGLQRDAEAPDRTLTTRTPESPGWRSS
jgi:class 3 adenylate cyclase